MARIWTLVSLLALAANLLCILWLARLEAAGPQHIDLMLDGGAPATLYLPASADADRGAENLGGPPAVVLAHGFASDRAGTSLLARARTQAAQVVPPLLRHQLLARDKRDPLPSGTPWPTP